MNAIEALQKTFGYAQFRPGQEELVNALISGRDVLAVMPTGAGKSLCYQIPALVQLGITLVISPLISLMKDQVAALKSCGVAAAFINSSLTASQQAEALRRAALGAYQIIYVAPERLELAAFRAFAAAARLSLIAVDEAHCVSQWGQDFRPSYLRISDFIDSLPTRPPVGAFTATATIRVAEDMVRLLRLQNPLSRTLGFDRPNLHFSVLKPKSRMSALMSIVRARPDQNGIVYCLTRKTVEQVCETLNAMGVSATRYHAGLTDAERKQNQEDFQFDRTRVMVATNAFGMGIDKSNVSYVIHFNMPKDLESYYQEAGRAGRDGEPADCVLLYGGQDVYTARWLIEHGEENEALSETERRLLRLREMERLRQMTFYATSKRCLRRFILEYFGQKAPEACGNCSVCQPGAVEACVDMDSAPQKPRRAVQAHDRAAVAHTEKQSALQEVRPEDQVLFDALRALRGQIASAKKVPAYVIFNDATLRAMARVRPCSRQAMLTIPGVGAFKLKEFGDDFLSAIRAHAGVNDEFWD